MQTINGTIAISISKTDREYTMSLVPGSSNPHSGAYAGDYFRSIGFRQTSFLPNMEATPQTLDKVFTKGFCILLFSSNVAVGRAL